VLSAALARLPLLAAKASDTRSRSGPACCPQLSLACLCSSTRTCSRSARTCRVPVLLLHPRRDVGGGGSLDLFKWHGRRIYSSIEDIEQQVTVRNRLFNMNRPV